MTEIFVSVCTMIIFFFVVLSIKKSLFDESRNPREEAAAFIVERQSFLHPILISLYGLLLALIAMALYYFQYFSIAIILYIIASYVDAIDGAVARASGLVTDVGKEIDPLFDKIKTLPPIIFFAYLGCFEMWFAITFFCLEVVGQLVRPVIHVLNWKYKWTLSVASNKFGQIKTVLVSILIIYCDLQVRVDFIPDVAFYGLGIVMLFGILSILFKFKEEIPPLQQVYQGLIESRLL